MKFDRLKNFINGQFVDVDESNVISVISPGDGTLLTEVPCSGMRELNKAVVAAEAAFIKWSKTPVKERVQVFFRYKYLLEKNIRELAELGRRKMENH